MEPLMRGILEPANLSFVEGFVHSPKVKHVLAL